MPELQTITDDVTASAERQVLGAVFINPAVLPNLRETLTADAFGDLRIGDAFATVCTLSDEGVTPDAWVTAERLRQTRPGGRVPLTLPDLMEIHTETATAGNATYYARHVANAAVKRAAAADALRVHQLAISGAPVADIVVGVSALADRMKGAQNATSDAISATHGLTFTDGGTFLFDIPDHTPAVWGTGSEVLWAKGEALIIAGGSGVGKTTIAGQVVRARLGLQSTVLGLDVAQSDSRVLYLAMDRPAQARRALARTFRGDPRDLIADRLRVWAGPPPADLAKHSGLLTELAERAGADTVIVDSLKDAAIGLTEDEVGASYNRARQTALAAGIDLMELHHMVKRTPTGDRPTTVEGLYGSVWITAGAGSVVLMSGAPGDPIVNLTHLKQPAEAVGPWRVIHDHETGVSEIFHAADPLQLLTLAGMGGISAPELARSIFETEKPDRNEIEKARRKLAALERSGRAYTTERPNPNGGHPITVYVSTGSESNHGATTHPSLTDTTTEPANAHVPDETAGGATTEATTATTQGSNHGSTPLYKRGEPGASNLAGYCKECGQTEPRHTSRCSRALDGAA